MSMAGNGVSGAAGGYLSGVGREQDRSTSRVRRNTGRKGKKKKLNYNYREISQRILRAAKSAAAATVLASARTKLSTLRRSEGTGTYDEQELRNAIIHARKMVQCASKKVQNLKEEETEKKRLARRNGSEDTVRKIEAREKIERKERQLQQELMQKEAVQLQKAKREWQEYEQKKKWNRSDERRKVFEADMKYIKGQISSRQDQGCSGGEIARLRESLEELAREQARIEAGQGETAGETVRADAAAAELSAAVAEGSAESPVQIGGTVDISL